MTNESAIVIGVTADSSLSFHESLAQTLQRAGWDVHLVSTDGANLKRLSRNMTTHPIPMKRDPAPFSDIVALFKWFRVLRRVRPHTTIIGTPKAGLIGNLASWLCRVPRRIYYVHGLRLETSSGLMRRILLALERTASRTVTELIAVSRTVGDRLLQLDVAPSKKIFVLGDGSTNGVDVKRFRPATGSNETQKQRESIQLDPNLPTIGFIGRLAHDKGILDLAHALRILHEQGREFQFLLVGQVEDATGEAALDVLNSHHIPHIHVGHVSDTAPYYRAIDILCLPSYREGLSGVVLEGFASALAVVATNVTGITDLVTHGETGILVNKHSPIQLSEALDTVLRDPDLRTILGTNARSFVRDAYEEGHVMANHLHHLKGRTKR